jgi:hypothetical protein
MPQKNFHVEEISAEVSENSLVSNQAFMNF